jgi:flagella basal body P-ring formation protein FlgA
MMDHVNTILAKKLLFISGLTMALAAHAQPARHALSDIQNTARQHISQLLGKNDDERVVIQVGRLDPRLRLAQCEQALSAQLPQGNKLDQHISVAVSCRGAQQWMLYVPVTIKRFSKVLVANRHIGRNHKIKRDDFDLVEIDINAVGAGFLRDPEEVIGLIAKRTIRAGNTIKKRALKLPDVVKRGDSVTIRASSKNFQINMKGSALMNGAKGELISVRNNSSKRTVKALVVGRGIVKVPL